MNPSLPSNLSPPPLLVSPDFDFSLAKSQVPEIFGSNFELNAKIQEITLLVMRDIQKGLTFTSGHPAHLTFQQIVLTALPLKFSDVEFLKPENFQKHLALMEQFHLAISNIPTKTANFPPLVIPTLMHQSMGIEEKLFEVIYVNFCLEMELNDENKLLLEQISNIRDLLDLMIFIKKMIAGCNASTAEEKNEVCKTLSALPVAHRTAIFNQIEHIIPRMTTIKQRLDLVAVFKNVETKRIALLGQLFNLLFPALSCPTQLKLISISCLWKKDIPSLSPEVCTQILKTAALICNGKSWHNSDFQVLNILDALVKTSDKKMLPKIDSLCRQPLIMSIIECFPNGSQRVSILKALAKVPLSHAPIVLDAGYKIMTLYRSSLKYPVDGFRLSEWITTWSKNSFPPEKQMEELANLRQILLDWSQTSIVIKGRTEYVGLFNPHHMLCLLMTVPLEKRHSSKERVFEVLTTSLPNKILKYSAELMAS
jgi:hypothetical protein